MTNGVQNTTSITTESDTVIRIEREFDAPPELVWEAYTDPELLSEWLGPHGTRLTVVESTCARAARTAGSTRSTASSSGASTARSRRPRCSSPRSSSAARPGHVAVDRLELEELDGGRTRLVATSTYASKEDRDAALASGMKKGIVEGYEKFDAVLERLRNR